MRVLFEIFLVAPCPAVHRNYVIFDLHHPVHGPRRGGPALSHILRHTHIVKVYCVEIPRGLPIGVVPSEEYHLVVAYVFPIAEFN